MNGLILWDWLYYGWVALEVLIALVVWTGKARGSVQDGGSQMLLWIAILAANFGCGWARAVLRPDLPGSTIWLPGVAIATMVLALTIRCFAIFSLGRAFSANVAIRPDQQLRTHGMYRIVRHPSYLGLLLVMIAVGLYSGNWVGLLVAVVPTLAALLYRIQVEERVLRHAFGTQYSEYSLRTKRLVPGIY